MILQPIWPPSHVFYVTVTFTPRTCWWIQRSVCELSITRTLAWGRPVMIWYRCCSIARLARHRLYLLEERRLLGLSSLDPDEFAREFRLVTVQRGLKATGTFAYQTAVCGRGETYEPLI